MKLIVNGEESEIEGRTVADVVAKLGYQGRYFAVALNRSHVPYSQFADAPVRDGDSIEILMPMQGG